MDNQKIEELIKKHYNKYNGGFEDGYEQAIEVGCDNEIKMLREFAKDLLSRVKNESDKKIL